MKSSKPIFKAHPSSLGKLMTGFKSESDKIDLGLKISDLIQERDEGINASGNKVKWTKTKESNLKKYQERLNSFDSIGKTAQSVVKEWMTGQLTGNRKDIDTKQIHKGNLVESDGIELINKFYGYSAEKNTERIENDWVNGECDMIIRDKSLVIDHKASWDEFSFPLWEKEIPNEDYHWQVQGYADLYEVENISVIYTLQDIPESIAESLAWKECKRIGLDELDFDIYKKIKDRYTFSNLPDWLRVKRFDFKRNEQMISDAKIQIGQARKWIENETEFYNIYNKLKNKTK